MRTTSPFIATIATVALSTLAAGHARAADLIGTHYSATTPLYLMDQTTGAATAGASTGTGGITDLASSGTNGSVWGVVSSTNTLMRFNASTGAIEATVPMTGVNAVTGAPENIVSIAYDSTNNLIYGNTAVSFGGFNNLFRIDPGTGAASLVGNLQIDKMYALAWNPVDSFLYGANGEIGDASILWKINTASAVAASMGALSTTGNFDIAFRPGDNKLFLASSTTSSLYTVDPLTAAESLVGPYGGTSPNIAGLAFAVPEPGTWAMMAGGLLLMGRRLSARRERD